MFVVSCSFQFNHELGIRQNHGYSNQFKSVVGRGRLNLSTVTLSSHNTQLDALSLHLSDSICRPVHIVPFRYNMLVCRSSLIPGAANEIPILKTAVTALTRLYNSSNGNLLMLQLAPAVGIIAFAFCCLEPLLRHSRILFLNRSDSSWKKSSTYYVMTSYLQPLMLWFGASLVCRALDPVVLPSEASQAVKQRLLNFVRSLSTVLSIAYCLSSFIQQAQKLFVETNDSNETRNMGFQFAGKAVYSAVWIASVSLFMELLGFSTQKWLTAGGLGTVLLTLAGREIFTNFLSSLMIHATRPFVLNEWIQTKIEGYEVSGTVEHVGWWSPTIIRGDDREAVHIPNHKFTVNVVRNLSQKTHWRIKTHLAISHLDVKKINNIVADMRKVLAKNPQVEHKKLHRRVFLDNVNPENQALLILVSCFVKTSHFEEYLCVKEAVLLDLLRVISHHRARLATPIRTVHKMHSDADMENIPFSETIFTRARTATNRFLLIEPSYKINSDEKAKAQARTVHTTEEKEEEVNVTATPTSVSNADMRVPMTSDSKADDKITSTPSDSKLGSKFTETSSHSTADPTPSTSMPDCKTNSKVVVTSLSDSNSDSKIPATSTSDLKGQTPVYYKGVKENSGKQNSEVESVKMGVTSSISSPKSQVEAQDSEGLNPKDIMFPGSPSEKPQVTFSERSNSKGEQTTLGTSPDKQESEKLPAAPPSITRPTLGENMVLNVALDDSRQMLPIEEEMSPSPNTTDTKELAARVNGNESPSGGKDSKIGQSSAVPGAVTGGDQRDQER